LIREFFSTVKLKFFPWGPFIERSSNFLLIVRAIPVDGIRKLFSGVAGAPAALIRPAAMHDGVCASSFSQAFV
jgi:hypothetical protein